LILEQTICNSYQHISCVKLVVAERKNRMSHKIMLPVYLCLLRN